ncbi:hypothetical protein KEJ27_09990, partial [Candidatus Bathyarchaeota archaeon]|nr:hypothetical protein [Candidatus Bathyarchaeota archaeon]
ETIAAMLPILFLPYLTLLAVYLLGTFIFNEKNAFLAVLAFLSLFWFGLYFNKFSFGYPLFILSLYLLIKTIEQSRCSILTFIIMYITFTLTYPASIVIPLALALALVMAKVLVIIRLDKLEGYAAKLEIPITLVLLTGVLWVSWEMWTGITFDNLVLVAKDALVELMRMDLARDVAEAIYFTSYTPEYLPIVNLRLFWSIGMFMMSIIISTFSLFKKPRKTHIFLSSILLTLFLISVVIPFFSPASNAPGFGLRGVALSQPVTALFLVAIMRRKDSPKLLRKLQRCLGPLFLALISLFILLMPLLTYSHMAFVYSPTTNLAMHDFLTEKMKEGPVRVAVLGGQTVTDYYMFKNDKNFYPNPYREDPDPEELFIIENKSYDIIAMTFRVYTKDAFIRYEPSLTECILQLKFKIRNKLIYNKIYHADEWHEIYSKS